MKENLTSLRRKLGQNTAEYLIMLVLVAIGSIGLFSAFGGTLKKQLNYVINNLAGKSEDTKFDTELSAAQAAVNAGNGMDQKAAATKRYDPGTGGGN